MAQQAHACEPPAGVTVRRAFLIRQPGWAVAIVACALLIFSPARRADADPLPEVWLLGDSVTYGAALQVIPQAPQWQVVNYGLGGETSLQGITRAANLLATHGAPDLVVITYGTNDLVQELVGNPQYPDWTHIRDNVFTLASMFEAAGATVVIGQPVGVVPVGPENPNWELIDWFNQRFDPLRASLIGAGYPAVDFRIYEVSGWADAFHPKTVAYQTEIAPRIIRTVQAALTGQPTAVATFSLPGAQVTRWARSGDIFYVGAHTNDGAELTAIDVTSPTVPRTEWAAELGTDVNAIAVVPPHLFLAVDDDDSELTVLDMATGAVVGSYDVEGDTDGIGVAFGFGVLLLTTSDNQIALLDITDPTAPALLSTIPAGGPAPLWRPYAFSTPYDAGGTILAVARGSADPALTLLLADAAADQFQVVANLRDQLTFPDANGDGVWHLACLGDSNTWAGFYGSWCNTLDGNSPYAIWHEQFTVTNYGKLGAQVTNYAPSSTHGPAQLQQVITAGEADAVVLAFGTNDLAQGGKTPWQTLIAYIDLASQAEAAGMTPFIALTPPIIGNAPMNEKIASLNTLLQLVFPANRLIDFNSGFGPAHYLGDGVHMDGEGHNLRAVRAKDRVAIAAAVSILQVHDGALIFEGVDDARNYLGIVASSETATIVDWTAHPILLGPGCQPLGATFVASCAGTITGIVVEAGGGDDEVAIISSVPATMYGGDGNDTLSGGDGSDVLHGQLGNDTLTGGTGGDTISGGLGADVVDGGQDDDVLLSDPGADQLHGGSGTDTVDYRGHLFLPVTVTLDNVANDGGPSEQDNVFDDVEVVTLP